MPSFGPMSLKRLDTCDEDLQVLMLDVLARCPWQDPVSGMIIPDISVTCGFRNEEAQDLAFKRGTTQVKWPDSNHNSHPSPAVDVVPYHNARPHIHWDDIDEMEALSRLILECSDIRGIWVRWGGDWDRDGVRVDRDSDESFLDGPHYELVENDSLV